MRPLPLLAGLLVLALAWGGPLPAMAAHSFAAHMAIHMSVVALAAPLVAAAIAGGPWDLTARHPILLGPVATSVVELVVVWAWHAPALHGAGRGSTAIFAIEQASFLLAGVLVWTSCLGYAAGRRVAASLAGTFGLLLTSMHMTLLGALLAFATRPLYAHAGHGDAPAALADQQLGGIIMLIAGGAAYLAGGLFLTGRALFHQGTAARAEDG